MSPPLLPAAAGLPARPALHRMAMGIIHFYDENSMPWCYTVSNKQFIMQRSSNLLALAKGKWSYM
jgi:hypothetical protein